MGPIEATEASFVDQDSQFLIYKEYKQFAGFVGIKTICCNYKQLFLSGNKLHKHLKEKYSQKVKAISKEAYFVMRLVIRATAPIFLCTSTLANILTTLQNLRDAILIVKSTVSKSDVRFEYMFCNWNYVIVLAALKSSYKSHDESLSKDHTKTSPPINAN